MKKRQPSHPTIRRASIAAAVLVLSLCGLTIDPPVALSQPVGQEADLAGVWESNAGLRYTLTRTADGYGWVQRDLIQRGTISVNGRDLAISWNDPTGARNQATGRIADVTAEGVATRLEWDNGLVLVREDGPGDAPIQAAEADETPVPEGEDDDAGGRPDPAVPTDTQDASTHFDTKGKPPSPSTLSVRAANAANLPFADERDLEEAARGFIAAPPYKQIMADAGHVAWDMERYQFLLEDVDFAAIHPSLQRQARLNMSYGLYEVHPRIYQVRGFDLANISFIQGETGWIVFDPLTSTETARAALELVNEHLGERRVVAVVYSHSHADHWAGVRGVVDEADVRAGRVQIIAPSEFMYHAVSENVYAGNAMNRRLQFQYAVLLPAHPMGHVDQSIGKNVSAGSVGLIAPTRIIEDAFETLTVDGVTMVFQNTPNTEAPSEMNTWFPEFNAFWAAENITGTIHNIYTLRGAPVRDALGWSKYINEALYRFGLEADVMFASHSWPRWGNDRIQEVMRAQRDTYAHLNNQVLHLANQGVTINQIHNVYEVPSSLQAQWAARSYHGSVEHNSRAVINRYLGYWDADPTTLIPLSPGESAPLYVEMMGGRAPILARGRELYDQGRYRHAQEIVNKLVQAEPTNQEAKDLLADVFEQIGYQQESPSVRNSFLAAAFELRSGMPSGAAPSTASADVLIAMPTELFFDYLAIKMDSRRVEADGLEFKINFITPDRGERFVLELSNATLTNIEGYVVDDADLTVTVDRDDLDGVMTGQMTFDELVAEGRATLEGDAEVLRQLMSTLVTFTPDFEMMPGTSRN